MLSTVCSIKENQDCKFLSNLHIHSQLLSSTHTHTHTSEVTVTFLDTTLILGDPEITANIYCKSRNLPNTDTRSYSTDLR